MRPSPATWLIFAVIILTSGFVLRFRQFEIGSLLVASAIGAFWFFSKNHMVANLLVQALITIGYLPTIHKLLEGTARTEPLYPWFLAIGASACGAILAHLPHEETRESRTDAILSKVYAWRSLSCAGVVIFLTLR